MDQLLERFEIQCRKKVKNAPFLMGQGVWIDSDKLDWDDEVREVLKHGTLSVGFIGLAETLEGAHWGAPRGERARPRVLGLEIIGHMRARMDAGEQKAQPELLPAGHARRRTVGPLCQASTRRSTASWRAITDRDYYTNSFHVPVYYPISAYDKIAIEAPYHALTNAGHISYIEMDGDPTENLDAFERVIRCMKEKRHRLRFGQPSGGPGPGVRITPGSSGTSAPAADAMRTTACPLSGSAASPATWWGPWIGSTTPSGRRNMIG